MAEIATPGRRQYDLHLHEENEKLGLQIRELNGKVDTLTTVISDLNTKLMVFIAKSDGANQVVEARLRRLEDWQAATARYLIGIVITMGLALFFAIAKGAGLPLKP